MRGETVTALLATLDELEAHYGRPARPRLRDPYRMVLYRNCGYPQSERNCELGWAALRDQIGVRPEEILRAGRKRLAAALRSGGVEPSGAVGAASGVILLGLVQDILDLANVSNYWIEAIDGAVILSALFLARVIGGESTAEEK